MITTSVDPTEFSQIVPEDRFSVEPPHTNPSLATSLLDVTQTGSGLAISAVERIEQSESASVDHSLQEMIARCKRDIEIHPQSVRPRLNLALALINNGQLDVGAEMLREVLSSEPRNYLALTSLALLFFDRGELKDATEAYLRVHSSYPQDPSPLIGLASIELRRENFIGASEYLEKAVALDRGSVMAKYLLAMVFLRLGRHKESIALLRAGLRDSAPSAELNQGIAIAYLVSGDFKRAERAFLAALTINDHMASAIHGLAILNLQQRRFDKVVETLSNHLSRTPTDAQGRQLLARAYVELGQFSRARGQLILLVPRKVETPAEHAEVAHICNNIGFCFAHEGRATDAEFWLKRSIELNGKDSAAPYTNLARMFLLHGRFKEALSIITRVDDLKLTTADSVMLKSATLINLQKYDEAIGILQSLINTRSAPSATYAELGWLLADWKEEYDVALAVLREGFERDPSNVFVLNNLAYVHLMRGEPAFARAILDQVKNLSDNEIVLTATRGLLLLWEGDLTGGEELYKTAEALASQSGFKDLAASIRQKRHLELTRAYLRAGQLSNAAKHSQIGLNIMGGLGFYRYLDQLGELSRRLSLPANT
jgi:tetratricopeptide (TPR) repeat protein